MDTTQGKQQETLRRGTEPHRNAITQDTTQEKRHGTLRRGRERKQQEGNRTRRRKNGTELCVAARNHTETQSHRTRRRENGKKLCVAIEKRYGRAPTGHDAKKTSRNSASRQKTARRRLPPSPCCIYSSPD